MKETKSIHRGVGLLFLLLMVTFWACITAQVTRLNQNEYPPGDPDDVMVYLTPEDIKSEYEKIALIQGEGSWTNEKQMFEKAQQKAATLGANGIILGEVNEPSAGARVAAAVFGTGTTRRGHVVAVYVYPDDYSRDFSNPSQDVPQGNSSSGLRHVDFPREGKKLERTSPKRENVSPKARDSVQENTSLEDMNASIEEKIDEQKETPRNKLFYFRKVVASSTKFTDEQILKFYRKKYPSLKSKPDDELIILIEKKYKEIFENN